MHFLSAAAIVLLGLTACSPSPDSAPNEKPVVEASQAAPRVMTDTAPASASDADALFKRDEPADATMTLNRESAGWRVAFRAGGVPNGAATAADCELQAVGLQDREDVIAARVVPFEGELNVITAADIGADAPVIQVRMGPEGAFVQDGGAAARFCGMGSDIDGFYRRTGSPE
jgi:UDP:flavonoid glycosyltransferase YjiC (YdhE family)